MGHSRDWRRTLAATWLCLGVQACGSPPDESMAEPDGGKVDPQLPPDPLVLGHRGAGATHSSRVFPDNTLASVQLALDMGAEGFEVDVWMTADDVVVLAHDDELKMHRTDCEGRISESMWSDIADCPVLSAHAGEPPVMWTSLEDVMALGDAAGLVILDMKVDLSGTRGGEMRRTVEAVARAVSQQPGSADPVLGLYQPESRAYARDLGLRSCLKVHDRGWSREELLTNLEVVDDWGLCANYCILDDELARTLEERGHNLMIYPGGGDSAPMSEEALPPIVKNLRRWKAEAFLTGKLPVVLDLRGMKLDDVPDLTVEEQCDMLRIRPGL